MRRIWLVFSQAVTVAVAVVFVVGTFKPLWLQQGARVWAPVAVAPLSQVQASGVTVQVAAASPAASQPLSEAARRAVPAIVSVNASKKTSERATTPHAQDPVFRFFFGPRQRPTQPQPEPSMGMGSGVIVSPEGYLLTNNHVVNGAESVTVQLADGREANAIIVGTDPETDLAVLKIDLPNLPTVTLGDIGQLQVGDAVLAIGNPFNVGQTVTSGIVSALGRTGLGLSTFENFIQTDAAINPGNSGGALVDIQGNLVGINTAIYSRSGGSMGIGFAIPIDLARDVMTSLIRDGQVTRGWIGVQPRDLSEDMARALKLSVSDGVLITGVLQDGPAHEAGLKPGDVVRQIAGQPIHNTTQLLNVVASLKPQSTVAISLMRGEKALEIPVQVAQRKPNPERD
ncbi:Do family serine endopeptidase [Vitreoscilla filiformis]|uniref:Do family serine endopeptidase n=1 Tax=Vitreoscilla filiformis TaxID=63 RepID=UPI000B7A115F|nr:Do family serine endopeptidase [Vitreoscilla filiformis]